jgi:hypothetical protein
MDEAIKSIHNENQLLYFLKMDSDNKGAGTIPRVLFSTSGTRRQHLLNTNDNDNDNMDDTQEVLVENDYEGNHMDYTKRQLQPVCSAVMPLLANAGREFVLSLWSQADAAEMANKGRHCQNLVKHDLISNVPITLQRQALVSQLPSLLVLSCSRIEENWEKGVDNKVVYEKLPSLFAQENKVATLQQNFPAIDFAGPGMRVFQVTVSGSHTKEEQGYFDLLVAAGFLTKHGEEYVRSEQSSSKKLEFYWVVPTHSYSKWTSKKTHYMVPWEK